MAKKPPPKPPTKASPLRRGLVATLKRADAAVVPEAYQFLFQPARYKCAYGGRGAGRSWSFARALILRAQHRKTRILCAREIQSSISESVHRLLSDQIELLGFSDFFEIQQYAILGRNGSEFFFEGLRSNVSKIKSLEGIDIVWIEEAEAITEESWSKLIPTIRKRGSQIWCTFNPYLETDPTYRRFVTSPPPNAIVRKTTYRDNPFFPQELEDERLYLQGVDIDAYCWIWEGECRTVSDALILKGKFSVEPFDVQPAWSGPHFGLDFGFSRDPSAACALYIDDVLKILYVKAEFWALGADIDVLPAMLESAIPGISQHVVFCDSSRPESISYLQRNGVAGARAADKWSGSILDGIAYLRSFRKIVIDPACKRFLDECRNYCFRVDRLTGVPLPEPEDKFNHLIDSARYALSPLIRNLPLSGFFSRAALLVGGEPVDVPADRPLKIFAVLASTDDPGSAVGVVVFASSPHHGRALTVLHYDQAEVDQAIEPAWLASVFARMQELRAEWHVAHYAELFVEENDLGHVIMDIGVQHAAVHDPDGKAAMAAAYGTTTPAVPTITDVIFIGKKTLQPTIEARAVEVKNLVNAGQFVKLARSAYAQQSTFRSSTTNHLTAQLFGYRPEASKDTAQELVNAFCVGITLANPNRIQP
jgi:phage terminase large subunit